MAKAAVDLVCYLPAPATKANGGAADLLDDQLFAYGCGPSIVVAEVPKLHVLLVLHGGHKDAVVTAVKWAPDCHSRDLKSSSHVRLASGDSEGRVVVWDVRNCQPLSRLSDRVADASAAGGLTNNSSLGGPVAGLEWVASQPSLLAVLLLQGALVLWDTRGGVVVWRRELMVGGELCCCLARDPLDATRLVVCGSQGALTLVSLTDPQANAVDLKQYRVSLGNTTPEPSTPKGSSSAPAPSSATPTFQAMFPAARDLLFLTLAREIMAFDLELGVPAATIGLPNSRPSFSWLLGVYGRGTTHGLGDEGGADIVVAAHVEGSLSIWTRCIGELRYMNSGWFRLTPTPVKGTTSITVVAARAKVWSLSAWDATGLPGRPGAGTDEDTTRRLTAYLVPDRGAPDASGGRDIFGGMTPRSSRQPAPASTNAGSCGRAGALPPVLIVSVTSDGRMWQWQAQLPRMPHRKYNPTSPTLQTLQGVPSPLSPTPAVPAAAPTLIAMRQLLPQPVTCVAMFPLPVVTNSTTPLLSETAGSRTAASSPGVPGAGTDQGIVGYTVLLGAAMTTGGNVQIFTMHRGNMMPLSCQVAFSMSVHREGASMRGLRWLGATPRFITFSSEKLQSGQGGNWRNTVAITDLRTRRTTYIREIASEPHRMINVRPSPSGFHVLLRLQEAPTELWAVGVDPPIKLMSLDVDWSAPEWLSTTDPTANAHPRLQDLLQWPTAAKDSTGATRAGQQPYADTATPGPVDPSAAVPYPKPVSAWQKTVNDITALAPEERLIYTHQDGEKSGVLRIRGRIVVNADKRAEDLEGKQDEPLPPPMPHFHATAMAGWGTVVVMGDPEGRLAVWSTASGAFSVTHTGYGVVRRIYLAPPPNPVLYSSPDNQSIAVRVAVVFGDGSFGVYELSNRGVLRPGHASPLVTTKAVGRVSDLSWLNLPCEDSAGSLLMAVTETGSLAVYDVCQAVDRRPSPLHRTATLRALLHHPLLLEPPLPLSPTPSSLPPRTPSGNERDMLGDEVPLIVPTPLAVQPDQVTHVMLAPPEPMGSGLLLPRAWLLLLRLLLQQGIQEKTLRALAGLSDPAGQQQGGEGNGLAPGCQEAVEDLMTLLPTATHQQLLVALGRHAPGGGYTPRVDGRSFRFMGLPSPTVTPNLDPSPFHDLALPSPYSTGPMSVPPGLKVPPPPESVSAPGTTPPTPSGYMSVPPTPSGGMSIPPTPSGGSMGIMRAMVGEAYKMVKTTTQGLMGPQASSGPSTTTTDLNGSAPRDPGAGAVEDGSSAHGRRHMSSGFHADLVGLFKHLAKTRADGELLHPGEWEAYIANLAATQSQPSVPGLRYLPSHPPASSTPAAHQAPTKDTGPAPAALRSSGSGSTGTAAPAAAPGFPLPPVGAGGGVAGTGSTELRVRPLCGCLVVAAQVAGDREEAAFWAHLPTTLQSVRDLQDALASRHAAPLYQQPLGGMGVSSTPGRAMAVHAHEAAPPLRVPHHTMEAGNHTTGHAQSSARGTPNHSGGQLTLDPSDARISGACPRLWDEDVALGEAQERALWHESLSRSVFQNSQDLQEKRMLEYVVLGDFQTAVAFLLASSPEVSVRYYRDALVTTALAAAANAKPGTGARHMGSALQLQAAKVLSAHAASIGDPLLGVPLHCAAGLYTEAVTLLQECGLWRYAANLTAHALTASERGAALQRWAQHVATKEGSMWRAIGILVSAGCCREALHMLQDSGRPDSSAAFLAACHAAGLTQTVAVPASPATTMPPTGLPPRISTTLPGPQGSQGRLSGNLPGPQGPAPQAPQGPAPQARLSSAMSGGAPPPRRLTIPGDTNPDLSPTPSVTIGGRASHDGHGPAHRLSMTRGEILQQTVAAHPPPLQKQISSFDPFESSHPGNGGLNGTTDVDALLSRTLSSGWSTSHTRVFSVLALGQGGQEGPGQSGQQQDDVGPVTAAFVSYVCDLLKHM